MTTAEAIERVLATARKEIGVREVGGPNRGPRVEEYLKRVHWTPGAAWCAAFTGFCGSTALGEDWPLPLVPGTWSLYDFAVRHGWLRQQPAHGFQFLIWSPKRKSWHTGFVDVFTSGGWKTIEGNTGPDGGHDGDGVYERTRMFGPADRFIDWTLGLPDQPQLGSMA